MDVHLSPQESARRRVRVTPLLVAIVCAVLLGIALTLQITSWSTLATESGGSCGTSHGVSYGTCPRGMAWLIPVSLIALIILVPATLLTAVRAAPGRLGRLGCVGAVVLAGLGVLPGLAIFHWAHGTTLKTVWTAQPDRPGDVRGLGVWLRDTTIVRARYDGLVGYDVATGAKRWTYTLPGTDVLCGMSRTTASGVGLIAHGAMPRPCGRVTAVDLGTGRALWQQNLPATRGLSSSVTPDVIAVTGDVAIVQFPEMIKAVGLRDGRARWVSKASDLCRFSHVAAGTGRILTEYDCANAVPGIRTLDPASGRTRWEVTAPIQSTSASITLLSATPAVVRIDESGLRGKDVIVSLDDEGRTRATIPVDDGDRRLDVSTHGFTATPVRRTFVQDGLLVAEARQQNGGERVLAYGLTDGRMRWSTAVTDAGGMQVESGRVLLVGDSPRNPGLWSIALRDGKQTYRGVTRFHWVITDLALYPSGGRILVAAESATTRGTFPVAAISTG